MYVFIANYLILETKRELRNTLLRLLLRFILPVKNNLLIFLFIIFVLVAVSQLIQGGYHDSCHVVSVKNSVSLFTNKAYRYSEIPKYRLQTILYFMILTTFMYIWCTNVSMYECNEYIYIYKNINNGFHWVLRALFSSSHFLFANLNNENV